MTKRRAIRLLGPITLGTAIVGGSVLLRPDDERPLRRWSDEGAAELPALARQLAEDRRDPQPIIGSLTAPASEAPAPDALGPLAVTAAKQTASAAAPPRPRLSPRARAQATVSDTALAGRLAEQLRLMEPVTPLIPEQYRQDIQGGPQGIQPPAKAARPLPEPTFGMIAAADEASLAGMPEGQALLIAPAPAPLAEAQPGNLADEAAAIMATYSAPIPPAALAGEVQLADIAAPPPRNGAGDDAAAALAIPLVQGAEPYVLAAHLAQPEDAAELAAAPVQEAASEAVTSGEAAGLLDLPERAEPLAEPLTAQLSLPPAPGEATAEGAELAARSQGIDFTPGRQVFPASSDLQPFTYDDELILQIQVQGISVSDTIIAYGSREGIYLPLGELARILDLAIRISDDGHYASGWFLSEDRSLVIDLRQGLLTTGGNTGPLHGAMAQAFDGELYLRAEAFAMLLPLKVEPDLRAQSVLLTTLEPFPFEERMRREAQRDRLNSRNGVAEQDAWHREETPWLALSVPMADVELRGVSDSAKGTRLEGDLRLAGDLAFMTAQTFFSATSQDGLVSSLVELGRRDADGDLLGPLQATEFQIGDVATGNMPMGLRGNAGRGAYITNTPFESVSVFDQIDLRGVLPDGYEVELYRNDILLGSTGDVVNGQYEFLQIPVDYGINVFRLIFYGPQGQRREEVRRISVGDGRLSPGQLQYTFGAVQRGVNLLGVESPDFRPNATYGDWQAVGEMSYGISTAVTGIASAAVFEDEGARRWLATAGLRSGVAGLALRGDVGFSDGGGHAIGAGIGGRALGGGFTVSHFEYGGGFIDEVRSLGSELLRRSSEVDFNTSLHIGGAIDGTWLPLTARARRVEYQDGRTRTNASLRSSARLPGIILSNMVEYLHTTTSGGIGFSQLVGNFDLATFNRSSTQLRGSVGYSVLPDPKLTQISGEVVQKLDDRTVVSAGASYTFNNDDVIFSLSSVREFDRFSVALDGQYAVDQGSYSVALRFGFSLGRDPMRHRVYMAQPGQAGSGAIALRAFHDLDGNGVFGGPDMPLPEVNFAVYNNVATTDEQGIARLGELGNGNRVSVQADPSSFPDIMMAPVNRGIEIVPRAGRFHVSDFAIVSLSELEGTVTFAGGDSSRGVSGLRLQLVAEGGEAEHFVRTERGGYFFFEQVKPGQYQLIIDPQQAARLGICLTAMDPVIIAPAGDIVMRDAQVYTCEDGPPETG